jgi:hypothetical protein
VQGGKEILEVTRDETGTWFGGIEFADAVAPVKAVALQESRFWLFRKSHAHHDSSTFSSDTASDVWHKGRDDLVSRKLKK